ncbi:MAG: hypothetical protein AAB607_01340 [Patescibacteria group bacterium]
MKKISKIKKEPRRKEIERKELEKKVIEGAQKALKEYRRVFERLAEYDKT